MTDQADSTLYDDYARTPQGGRELAAADLALSVGELLRSAFNHSGLSNHEFGLALGVSDGRASQILNSDGNLRVSTIAKALQSLGWSASIAAKNDEGATLPAMRRPRIRAEDKRRPRGWASVQVCTYEVRMMGSSGVDTHRFDVEHGDSASPVMLETPMPVGTPRHSLRMEAVITSEELDEANAPQMPVKA